MNFIHQTELLTDESGMVKLEHESLKPPILFLYNEVQKYSQGYIKWHWHPEMEFNMVKDNPVEIYIEDRRIVLRKGEGIWINSNKMHMVRCPEGFDSATIYTILFLPEFIAHKSSYIHQKYVLPWLNDPEMCYVLFLEDIEWHKDVLKLLENAYFTHGGQSYAHELSIHNSICQAWLTMLQHEKEVPKQVISRTERHSQDRIKTMIEFIQENYTEHLTLYQIADAAHVSKSECIRCFKKNLDMTPIQYLTEYRMETAARLLISSSDTVRRIAEHCGFDDVSYFSKQFRTLHGVTPSEYRRINGMRGK